MKNVCTTLLNDEVVKVLTEDSICQDFMLNYFTVGAIHGKLFDSDASTYAKKSTMLPKKQRPHM